MTQVSSIGIAQRSLIVATVSFLMCFILFFVWYASPGFAVAVVCYTDSASLAYVNTFHRDARVRLAMLTFIEHNKLSRFKSRVDIMSTSDGSIEVRVRAAEVAGAL